jgi:hypothetical protein
VVEFGEWLCEEVLKAVPHRHFIFSIPKILRRYFLYDRKLLSELSRCAWDSMKVFFQTIVPEEDAVPGAVIAIQTLGISWDSTPLPCLMHGWRFLWKRHVQGGALFIQRDLKDCSIQGFQNAPFQKKITENGSI